MANSENIQVDLADLSFETCECPPELLKAAQEANRHRRQKALEYRAASVLFDQISTNITDKFSGKDQFRVLIDLDNGLVKRVTEDDYKKAVSKAKRRATMARKKGVMATMPDSPAAKKRATKKRTTKKRAAKKRASKKT